MGRTSRAHEEMRNASNILNGKPETR